MVLWQVEFSKDAYKSYQKLSKSYQSQINKILNFLVRRERVDIKPVEGEENIYRLRVGKYRVLIKFLKEKNVILVAKIGPRGDVYK